jgi:Large ribosomal RNA subunit accumulation protein YceD
MAHSASLTLRALAQFLKGLKKMDKAENAWALPAAVEDIPEAGLHLKIEAPEAIRLKIAQLAGLRDLPRLAAEFDLVRRGAGVRVTGRVSATVGQTCVVTLDPVENEIEEAVDLVFAPSAVVAGHGEPRGARKRAKTGEEPPEPLIDGKIDLGALATEFLILGIDPYPRKSGAKFAAPKVADRNSNAFAALEARKTRSGSDRP